MGLGVGLSPPGSLEMRSLTGDKEHGETGQGQVQASLPWSPSKLCLYLNLYATSRKLTHSRCRMLWRPYPSSTVWSGSPWWLSSSGATSTKVRHVRVRPEYLQTVLRISAGHWQVHESPAGQHCGVHRRDTDREPGRGLRQRQQRPLHQSGWGGQREDGGVEFSIY